MTTVTGTSAPRAVSSGVGAQRSLRASNQTRVTEVLAGSGPTPQADLARRTGLSRATVSNIVRELTRRGEVTVSVVTRGGRRAHCVALVARPRVVAGLDFGHRHLRIALGDGSGAVLAEHLESLPVGHDVDRDLELADRLLSDLVTRAGVDPARLTVGVGLPAPIDQLTGEVGSSLILPGWTGVRAADYVSERLGHPAYVGNDANLGALAESRWGAGADVEHFAYVKVSTGIGAGLVLAGRVYEGGLGTAGELGHATVDEFGPLCVCGQRGCLEIVAGGQAVLRLLAPLVDADLTLDDAVRLAVEGYQPARRAIVDSGRILGLALANMCDLLALQSIVIGGTVAGAGDLYLAPIRDVIARQVVRPAARVGVVASRFGPHSEVRGAMALALSRPEPTALAERVTTGSRRHATAVGA